MNTTLLFGDKQVQIEVAACCHENSPVHVLARPDLEPTDDPDYRVCRKCGRTWKKCIAYAGASLYVTHDWVPQPFDSEK